MHIPGEAMKSDHMQAYEHNLTVPDEILFRKRSNRGPAVGTVVHPPTQNHPWRTRGFVGAGKADDRLTITDDGWRWE